MVQITWVGPRKPEWNVYKFITSWGNQFSDVSINETYIIDSIVKSIASWFDNDVRAITFEEIKDEVAKDQETLDLINAIENKDVADRFPDTVAGYNINC